MKKFLLPLLFVGLLLSACNQPAAAPSGEPSGGGQIEGGSTETSATVDFTVPHEKVDNVPSTGDSTNSKFLTILNKYYFTNTNVTIESISGTYININAGFSVTETRSYPQMLMIGSRNNEADFTFNFVNTIKSVTFVCEAYCKYVSYNSTYNVDYATYLTVNGEKKDIAIHAASDVNETQNLKYTVNSKQVRLQAPNTNTGGEDTKANRIIVYQMVFEF